MELNKPIELKLTSRYFQQNRAHAIRDVFDALVELITNSDDSYHRLYKKQKISDDGGRILIEVNVQRKGKPSELIVRDKAEGMTLDGMKKKLSIVGDRTSEKGDRGLMSRGLKDCTAIGDVVVESIVGNRYYRCRITRSPAQFIAEANENASSIIRKELGVDKNGTSVTILVSPDKRVPRIDTIISELPHIYSLRDILSDKSPTKVSIRSGGKKTEKIIYMQPEGNLVINEKFELPEYPKARCTLKIWKAQSELDDKSSGKFRRSGIVIKGKRAIHECSLLHDGLEKDEIAKKFVGRLECEYIDDLIDEFDEREMTGQPHPDSNPKFLIDPNRQHGLLKDHAFTSALFRHPTDVLRKLIEEEKQKTLKKKEEIANATTKKKLTELARAASKFLSQQVDEIEELTRGGSINKDAIAKSGIVIFPKYFNVSLGEERLITLYANSKMLDGCLDIRVWSKDKNTLFILDRQPKLRPHSKKEDRMVTTFRVRGDRLSSSPVTLVVKCGNLSTVEAYGKVVDNRGEEHEFRDDLEFGNKKYTVKEGRKRTLKVYAKYPEILTTETQILIISSDSESLAVKGRCVLSPVTGSNFAIGEVLVHGRRVKKRAITLTANLNGHTAKCGVRIITQDEQKIDFDFTLVDKDLGNFRAAWADHEGRPNLLEISAQHNSVKRYLGDNFQGQDTMHFRILIAEIVAESICRKALQYETREHPWDFRFADLGEDSLIADTIFVEFQKRMRRFLPIAHKVMLSDADLTGFLS